MKRLIILAFVLLPLFLSACGVRTWWDYELEERENGTLVRDTAIDVDLSADFNSLGSSWQQASINIRRRGDAAVEIRSAELTLHEVGGGGGPTSDGPFEPMSVQAWRGSGWNWRSSDDRVTLGPDPGGTPVTLDHAPMRYTITYFYSKTDLGKATRVRATVHVRLLVDGKPVEIERNLFLRKDLHTSAWFLRDC